MHEKKLVSTLKDLFEREKTATNLKRVYASVNLATKGFREIWSAWWEERPPGALEVDLIPIFKTQQGLCMIGVEVEHFKEGIKRSPYAGLEQALSFGLFGFDSIVLWHIFDPTVSNATVEGYIRPVSELLQGYGLPLVYLGTKFFGDDTFEFFAPIQSSIRSDARHVLGYIENLCREKRNPMLLSDEVKRRRDVLKVMLKIPA